MKTFREYLAEAKVEKELNEGASDAAKKFMKEFNQAISFLKDDVKNSDKNQDWYVRLEYIGNMIQRELKNR